MQSKRCNKFVAGLLFCGSIFLEGGPSKIEIVESMEYFIDSMREVVDPTVEKVVLLNVDGGGVLSAISLEILMELEQIAGKKCADVFTAFSGVSAGAVVVCGLTPVKETESYSARQISDLFDRAVNECFQESYFRKLRVGFGLFGSVFDGKGKKAALLSYVKNRKVSDFAADVFLLATDVRTGNPCIFGKDFNTLKKGEEFFVREVLDASTATPIFFPSVIVESHPSGLAYDLIDGGVSRNDLDVVALEFLKARYPNAKIHVLSLGVRHQMARSRIEPIRWGVLDWVFKGRLISTLIQTNTRATTALIEYEARTKGTNLVQYIRIAPILPEGYNSAFKVDLEYRERLRAFGRKVAKEEHDRLAAFVKRINE